MTSGAQITAAAVFDRLEGAALNIRSRRIGSFRRPGDDRLDQKFVIQTFVLEVAFFLSHPLLQASVRLNAEFAHLAFLSVGRDDKVYFFFYSRRFRDATWPIVSELSCWTPAAR